MWQVVGSLGTGACRWQLADVVEMSLLAVRALGDIDARQAQDALDRCFLIGCGRWWCRDELLADSGQNGLLATRGKPTVSAGLLEATRQDVQQEAADEVHDGDGQCLGFVAIGSIKPCEGDLVVLNGKNTVIGNGHAMGVAPEVVQCLLWVLAVALG